MSELDRQLEAGQQVLILLPTSSHKLLMQWKGPFTVTRKVNKWNYVIDVNGVERKFHINMLKRYFVREEEEYEPKEESACVAITLEEEGSVDANIHVIPSYQQMETREHVKVNDHLSEGQKRDVYEVMRRYDNVLNDVPGCTNVMKHEIKLKDTRPVKSRPYPIPYSVQDEIDKEIQQMLDLGIIEQSDSPYATPILVVRKKDGTNRVCLDFRKINKLTVFDAEPMPDQTDIMTKVSSSKYFSKIDLSRGYWQIPLQDESKPVTAFQTSKGLMQFRVLPFGLINASASFNRLMRGLFKDVKNVESFVDDILIHTSDWKHHLEVLDQVFHILSRAGLTARPSKCEIGNYTIEYLGHVIGEGVSKPVHDKVAAVSEMRIPVTKKEVRSFLGMAGYYRQYIPDYSTIAAPLTDLTKKSVPNKVTWAPVHQKSFDKLKSMLSSQPVLRLVDMTKTFSLQTDASDVGVGGALLQLDEDGERWPVAYASRKLKGAEINYSVIEKECLAIVWCIKKFYRYLYGKHFCLETDHQPLKYLQTATQLSGRLMRWSIYLQQFNFTVCSIKGSENVGADCLSRLC